MSWSVLFGDPFDVEFEALAQTVQDELLASAKLPGAFGPRLGRPQADALNGTSFANMKELRFAADGGVWRVAFAFDPQRRAILPAAGDKSGGNGARFYRTLIVKTDARYRSHLQRMASARKGRT